MLPMFQSEALWLNINSKYLMDRHTGYPFAIKVAAGKINAVTGDDWDIDQKSRCFVHIANSLVRRAITGEAPPTVPFTAKEYTRHGLP